MAVLEQKHKEPRLKVVYTSLAQPKDVFIEKLRDYCLEQEQKEIKRDQGVEANLTRDYFRKLMEQGIIAIDNAYETYKDFKQNEVKTLPSQQLEQAKEELNILQKAKILNEIPAKDNLVKVLEEIEKESNLRLNNYNKLQNLYFGPNTADYLDEDGTFKEEKLDESINALSHAINGDAGNDEIEYPEGQKIRIYELYSKLCKLREWYKLSG